MVSSAKRPSSRTPAKASKNEVGVQIVKDRIRLSLPREISRAVYGVEQKIISPGLPATPEAVKSMESKAARMTADILTGHFDPTLERYELGVVAANKLVSIDGGKKPELGISELWEKFKEYKRPSLAETTFINRWEKKYTKYITCAIKETGGTPIEIRNYLATNYCSLLVKAVLSNLELCYKWGIQHELVTKNPFLGMASEIVIIKKQQENDSLDEIEDTRAFTLDEMNAIIEYFENTPTVKHWADYVKFLFYTGCRPGEAAALRWKHISLDCKVIRFSQSYDASSRITKCTKTDTLRIFPCHSKLQLLLLEMKKENNNNDSLVFAGKRNGQVDPNTFVQLWRGRPNSRVKGVMPILIEQGKVKQYLKAYATRHTFITIQVNNGRDAHVIAAWVGNSAENIWKYYYQHKQDEQPADM